MTLLCSRINLSACLLSLLALLHYLLNQAREASLHRWPGPGPQRPLAGGPLSKWGEAANTEGVAPGKETQAPEPRLRGGWKRYNTDLLFQPGDANYHAVTALPLAVPSLTQGQGLGKGKETTERDDRKEEGRNLSTKAHESKI